MDGLDTNVLVRFLLRDDEKQAQQARAAIEAAASNERPLRLSLLTVLETEWVLRSLAKFDKATVIETFQALLETRDLLIESEATLEQALHHFKNHTADFADCLMAAHYQQLGCRHMLTFDARAARLPGARLVAPRAAD